jgi:hypothetical protein
MWRLDLPWWFDQVAIRILRIKARHVPTDGCAGETGRFISGGSTHTVGQELSLITGSLSDDATPDAIFASTGSLHLLS